MDILNNYIELMGDTEFAVYVASFVFGLILFVGLIGKLAEGKAKIPKPIEPKAEPKKVEKPKEKEKSAVPPPAEPTAFDGVMMWEGDSGKTKKNTMPPSPPVKPVVVLPPLAPKIAEKIEKDATVKADVSPVSAAEAPAPPLSSVPPSSPATRPEEKTVIIPPKAGPSPIAAETLSSPSEVPSVTSVDAPEGEKLLVDFSMYEMLVRRIAGLEADVKREPLYLDPLMKRLANAEKRLESVSSSGTSGAGGAGSDGEVKELKDKVLKIQKFLEQLSEGPSPDASSKTSSTP